MANIWYGFPSKKIKIIGVTGTNGKTTTCQMIARVLEESGAKVAMASTINFKLGEKVWTNESKFTTFSSFKIQKFTKDAVGEKCEYLVLETSSHSLDQNRVWGVEYDIAVITNVTREHFDYHKNIKNYRLAKLKLFQNARTAVVNLDMDRPEDFLKYGKDKFGYSVRNHEARIMNQGTNLIKAENIEQSIKNISFMIHDTGFMIHLPGLFNVENALAAACVGLAYGISLDTIALALKKIEGIPGRMEYISNNLGIKIIIDYAVTPDSLERLYDLIEKNKKNGRIISVFGACGERDCGKRPIMGEIVDRYADYIILTNEDPYREDPEKIVNELAKGIMNKKEGENLFKIMDRKESIKKALRLAKACDIVVVTGKGAETSMAIENKMFAWNDKKVIQEVLREL